MDNNDREIERKDNDINMPQEPYNVSAQLEGERTELITPSLDTEKRKLKKSKLKLLVPIIFLIIILLIVTIKIVFKNKEKNDNLENKEYSESKSYSLSEKLKKDYISNQITADQYITYLLNYFYDYNELPQIYQTYSIDSEIKPNDVFDIAEQLSDKLSDETLENLYKKSILNDVAWNVESTNTESDSGIQQTANMKRDYRVEMLANDTNVSQLDNVMLSKNKNFLVYYTTTGKNAITDENAEQIAMYLESVVSKYKELYGMDFKYEDNINGVAEFGVAIKMTVKKLLKKKNIDTKYLDSAIAVYVIDTDVKNTGNYAFYMGNSNFIVQMLAKNSSQMTEAQKGSFATAYSFPYIVISSSVTDFDDIKIISAHELFHHYQRYICGNGKYKDCSSGLFTTETTANLAAAKASGINKLSSVLNLHAQKYVNNTDVSIDLIGQANSSEKGSGYAAFLFANNYASTVSNGLKILSESMTSKEPLKYLMDNSGGKYKNVLINLAIKNLTLNYDNKIFIPNKNGKTIYPKNRKKIGSSTVKTEDNIAYSSIHYYYVEPSNLKNKQIIYNGNSKDLTLVVLASKEGKYEYKKQYSLNNDVVIKVNEYSNYDTLAIAIVNSQITDMLSYTYRVENSEEEKENTSYNECFDYEINNGEVTIINKSLSRCPESLIIPDKIEGYPVTKIGELAFAMESEIKSVTLGANVKSVGRLAFSSGSLSTIILNEKLEIIEESAFDKNNIKRIIIPDSVVTIENMAFSHNPIEELKLGNHLEVIGEYAFYNYSFDEPADLKDLIISDSVKEIGKNAFCHLNIRNLTLGKNLETIKAGVFSNNKIVKLTIPDNVKTVEVSAFCDNPLEMVTVGKNVTTLGYSSLKSEKLTKIINHSGKAFDWKSVTANLSLDCPNYTACKIVTGKIKYYFSDEGITITN